MEMLTNRFTPKRTATSSTLKVAIKLVRTPRAAGCRSARDGRSVHDDIGVGSYVMAEDAAARVGEALWG